MLLDHEKESPNCEACWSGFPKRCDCGGLIHAEWGDYTDAYTGCFYLDMECSNPKCDCDIHSLVD